MSFVGPGQPLGDAWCRPHDLELCHPYATAPSEAMVERDRPSRLRGAVELARADGEPMSRR